MTMEKNFIRLTESDLHRIIEDCIKRIINEGDGCLPSRQDTAEDGTVRNWDEYKPKGMTLHKQSQKPTIRRAMTLPKK